MLLVLVSFASVINATHHHDRLRLASDSSISYGGEENSNGAPGSSDASHCAACRLQRGFESALRSLAITFEIRPHTLIYEAGPREPDLLGASIIFSSRGPPPKTQS